MSFESLFETTYSCKAITENIFGSDITTWDWVLGANHCKLVPKCAFDLFVYRE